MDYEAIDRDMSSWVVSCVKETTRFYITDGDLATDIPSHARRYRWLDQAEKAAAQASKEFSVGASGMDWEPVRVASMWRL